MEEIILIHKLKNKSFKDKELRDLIKDIYFSSHITVYFAH